MGGPSSHPEPYHLTLAPCAPPPQRRGFERHPGSLVTPLSLSCGSGSAVLEVLTWLARSALSGTTLQENDPRAGEEFSGYGEALLGVGPCILLGTMLWALDYLGGDVHDTPDSRVRHRARSVTRWARSTSSGKSRSVWCRVVGRSKESSRGSVRVKPYDRGTSSSLGRTSGHGSASRTIRNVKIATRCPTDEELPTAGYVPISHRDHYETLVPVARKPTGKAPRGPRYASRWSFGDNPRAASIG